MPSLPRPLFPLERDIPYQRRMKVLFVIPNIVSYRSFLNELTVELHTVGIETHCACSLKSEMDSSGNAESCAAALYPLPAARGMNPIQHAQCALALRRVVRSVQPDIIHAHFSAAILTTALAYQSDWPITIGTYQGLSYPLVRGYRRRLVKLAEIWSSSRLDGTWVLTSDDYARLISDSGKAKVFQQRSLGFGCRTDLFDPRTIPNSEKSSLRESLGIATEDMVYAFIGRFTHFKGFDLTIRAFLRLNRENPKTKLLLIGSYDPLHPSGLSIDEINTLEQDRAVLQLGWQSNVQKYLAITDVFVFPSEREGVPVVLMEALSMGVPAITADSRGCREIVTNNVNGILLDTRNIDEVLRAMLLLDSDNELRRQLAFGALETRSRFNRRHYISEQIEIYSMLTGHHQ